MGILFLEAIFFSLLGFFLFIHLTSLIVRMVDSHFRRFRLQATPGHVQKSGEIAKPVHDRSRVQEFING